MTLTSFESILSFAQDAFASGDYARAEQQFLRALIQAEISYGYDSQATGIVLLNYVDFLCQQGRFEDSRPLLKRLCASLTSQHEQLHVL